ncbi:hypothetical protein HZC30_05140 [Candidatus Woesearchaeota archaeon]|nr:hypothetical protein [Candidatus Woesearchaeota archaeon]
MCKLMLEEKVSESSTLVRVESSLNRDSVPRRILGEVNLGYLETERGCGRYGCNCVNYDRSNCIIF